MSKPPPLSSTRSRSHRPFFTPPRSKSSAARKTCICNWGEGCCQLLKFFGDQTDHPYSGRPFDFTVSDTCDFVNFWKGCVRYFHLSPQQQEEISTSPPGGTDKRVRFRIARHHFPLAIVEHKISSPQMKLFRPLSREDISELGCYANMSPPPTQDSVFHYDTFLGRGVAASAAKRLHAELHFRVVPCMSRDEVMSMAAALQNAGTGEARLDMAATIDRSRSIEEWQEMADEDDEQERLCGRYAAALQKDDPPPKTVVGEKHAAKEAVAEPDTDAQNIAGDVTSKISAFLLSRQLTQPQSRNCASREQKRHRSRGRAQRLESRSGKSPPRKKQKQKAVVQSTSSPEDLGIGNVDASFNHESAKTNPTPEPSQSCDINSEAKPMQLPKEAPPPPVTDESIDNEDFPSKLPPDKRSRKMGFTPFGQLKSCMCRNPSVCRDLMWRWARLKEAKYICSLWFPNDPAAAETDAGRHVVAYRKAALRNLGYDSEGGGARSLGVGRGKVTTDNMPLSHPFISSVHFHPDVIPAIAHNSRGGGMRRVDKWRISIEEGNNIGLKEEDRCPTLDKNGDPSFFLVPNYSVEEATADVERAEAQYKQTLNEFREQNNQIASEMATDPSKYVMEIYDLKQQVSALKKENRELKEKARADLSEKVSAERKMERLQKGLEKIARRMDKWESAMNAGGTRNRDAKDIYREATGRDLSEDGFFGVEPSGTAKYRKGCGHMRWTDPRMDRAVQARWTDPEMSLEDALRVGGFEFPTSGGALEKHTMDSDGVTLTKRKAALKGWLKKKKRHLAKKAEDDPEAAREYDERFNKPDEGPRLYGGFDLSGIPEQPLIRSKNEAGYMGAKKSKYGRWMARVGVGGGKSVALGTFDTVEEAAGIYAKALYFLKQRKRTQDPEQYESEASQSEHNHIKGEMEE